MSAELVSFPSAPRPTSEERDKLREVAAAVASAATLVRHRRYGRISIDDLRALGMLAVWRALSTYDPARATFERWAYYKAFHAMLEAVRADQRERAFVKALRWGAQGHVEMDRSAAEQDVWNDTPETDLGRLCARTRSVAVTAWLEATMEQLDVRETSAEQSIEAAEAVRVVREEIARLPEEQRAIVRLRCWDDLEMVATAAQLGMSERTLRRRWVELREHLSASLRARGIDGTPPRLGDAVDAVDEGDE